MDVEKSDDVPCCEVKSKKQVKFADALGLVLEEVKRFRTCFPAATSMDVEESDDGPCCEVTVPRVYTTELVPMFTKPNTSTSFINTVHATNICLEQAFSEDQTSINGMIRVSNLDFHKTVTVRWTVNDWNTWMDEEAGYVDGDGRTDRFYFRLMIDSLPVGSRVQFCLKIDTAGTEFWDNNSGNNYVFQICAVDAVKSLSCDLDPDPVSNGNIVD